MSKENKNLDQKIKEWKEIHGGVFEMPVDDKTCYLREPNMDDYKRAFIAMQDNGNSAFGEVMLQSLWLEGDHEIKSNNDYFAPAKKEIMRLLRYDEPVITNLENRQKEIRIGDAVAVIRVITKEDVSNAEKRNPSDKPFVTQSVLFDLVKVSADSAFDNPKDASIRFPLYQALEKVQNEKVAQLKKL
jgi:hypothetical protein